MKGSLSAKKAEIISALEEFGVLNLTQENEKSVNERIEEITFLLDENKIPRNSGFDKRLDRAIERAETHFYLLATGRNTEVSADDFMKGKRNYVGVSRAHKIRIWPSFYNLVFYETCSSENTDPRGKYPVNVRWKFNREGRLLSVNVLELDTKVNHNIITVKQPEKLDWFDAKAEYNEMPYQIRALNPDFPSFPLVRQYRLLLWYGHNIIRDFLSDIQEKRVHDSIRRDGEN